ncbi:hypothetical protein [uncultured Albimonas sp.]|uniref:hypothetical protein n=1 Tax=uncultured Albimonas sp. TaxID=1331701 RepID=UPI0030EF9445
MPTRRARPIPLILCAPLALAAGVALAAQQDVSQQDLARPDFAQAGAPGESAASQPPESHAPAAIGEAQDDTLIAWPCLDAPGCGEPALAGTPMISAQDSAKDPAQIEATPIPLPAALGLMGAALTALGLFMRRRRDD